MSRRVKSLPQQREYIWRVLKMSSAEAWRKEVGGKEELARQITAGVVEKNSALETKKKKKG